MATEYLTLSEIKAAELRLLRIFDQFCRDNSLRYSLGYGTMLGAVRHKGFIPWDDDIDILMPVDDYREFVSTFPSQARIDDLRVGLASRLNFKGAAAIPFEKLVETGIEVKSAFIAEGIKEYLWIDIFPVVTFDNDSDARKAYKTATFYKNLFQASRWSTGEPGAKGRFKAFAGAVARKTPLQQWAFGKLKEMTDEGSYSSAGTAANLSWAVGGWLKIFPGRLFDELEEYEFENGRFYGFKDADCYLSATYGDYMTLPPVEQRVTHELKAWRVDALQEPRNNAAGVACG